jgi:hypothetical protein
MTCIRWSLVLLGLDLGAAAARAQGIFFPSPYTPGYRSGGFLGYSRVRPHSALSLSFGFNRGYLFGPGYGPYPPYFYPGLGMSQVSVTYYTSPTIVVMQPPRLLPDDLPPDLLPRNRLRPRPEDEPLPGEEAGVFRPLDPGNRDRARRPLPPPPPEPPPKKEEGMDLIALGRKAFAAQEYGRAAQRFRRAAAAAPREALPHFLLAQALFALGKYGEAVDAVLAGMALQPDWPAARFRPRELYGPHVADYPRHLARLKQTLARHPDDPDLLFLSAYQLWFDGRKEEARRLFERALPRAADRGAIDRFLRALPAGPAA